MDYVDSTFSSPSAAELRSVMADESNCEHGPLIELVFFPDESVQVRLEDLLGSDDRGYAHFGKSDEAKALAHLHSKQPVTTIRFADNRGKFEIDVHDFASAAFLSRLKVANTPDHALVSAIRNHVSEEWRTIMRVRLRNSRIHKSERNIRFLEKFFENAEKKSANMFTCLDFALKFVEETGADEDLFKSLGARKQRLLDNLNKAARLEAKIGSGNIETMILQGMRVPYADKAEMMRQVVMTDEIGMIVFGSAFP